jgi:hypothetical protein
MWKRAWERRFNSRFAQQIVPPFDFLRASPAAGARAASGDREHRRARAHWHVSSRISGSTRRRRSPRTRRSPRGRRRSPRSSEIRCIDWGQPWGHRTHCSRREGAIYPLLTRDLRVRPGEPTLQGYPPPSSQVRGRPAPRANRLRSVSPCRDVHRRPTMFFDSQRAPRSRTGNKRPPAAQ